MTTIDSLGVDIAKTVFQLHGVDQRGRPVLRRRVMRDRLLPVIETIEHCTVAWRPALARSSGHERSRHSVTR